MHRLPFIVWWLQSALPGLERKKDTAKDGGTTENMEVNTPALDKEERQDRGGGSSET